jgi:Family of unknown function (DUF6262)
VRPDPLCEAAARRHELTRAKAVQALRDLDRAGTPVTFAGVAQAAGISRSWLYTQPDISSQIRRLRQQTSPPRHVEGLLPHRPRPGAPLSRGITRDMAEGVPGQHRR